MEIAVFITLTVLCIFFLNRAQRWKAVADDLRDLSKINESNYERVIALYKEELYSLTAAYEEAKKYKEMISKIREVLK